MLTYSHPLTQRSLGRTRNPWPQEADFIETRKRLTLDAPKLVLVLVGLPARGKSFIGVKLQRFLSWRGWETRTFSVGAARRSVGAAGGSTGGGRGAHTAASFFDGSKAYAAAAREALAMETLAEMLKSNDDVKELHLRFCSLGPAGTSAIAQALRTNSSVEVVYLVTNKVGDDGAEALMAMLPYNASLRELHLQDNLFAPKTKEALKEAAKKRGLVLDV